MSSRYRTVASFATNAAQATKAVVATTAMAAVTFALGCDGTAFELDGAPADEDVAGVSAAVSPPSDPRFKEQWALRNTGQTVQINPNRGDITVEKGIDINILKAWDVTQGSPSVVVAIIEQLDIDVTHPDLAGNLFINPGEAGARANNGIDDDHNGYIDDVSGVDFIDRNGFNEPAEHPTHVGGIIAARIGNGQGISGVAPRVKLLPLRALANTAAMVEAINYAKRMGAKVVNVSQGGIEDEGYKRQDVFNAIRDSGMLFTCSAGNLTCLNGRCRGNTDLNYPSSFTVELGNVLSVANIDGTGELAPGSFYGEGNVDIAAPGTGILSTVPGPDYSFDIGTSMAAPHVAGVAALIASANPGMTAVQIADRILKTGMKMLSLNRLVRTSSMVDARAALTDVGPINLTASSIPGRITLTWNAQPGAVRYQVERDGTQVDNVSTTFVHSNLAVDSMHLYRVRAVIGTNFGPFSHRVAKRASQDPVAQPFFLQSPHPYPPDESLDFEASWPNAKRVRVHFSRVVTVPPDDTLEWEVANYDDSSLVSYTGNYPNGFWGNWIRGRFRFSLVSDAALNAFGFTIDRIEFVATIPDAPSPPFFFEAGPGFVNFGIGCTPGSNFTNVYRSTAAFGGYVRLATVDVNVGDYTDTTVTPGRTFYYRLSCSNDFGESPQSDFLKVLVPTQ
jgi:subtilisin family serine protease